MLEGEFSGETLAQGGSPAARIHVSSIDHLPVTREITKAVAMQNSCTFSGPSGNLSFWWPLGTRINFDVHFFTSFFPISQGALDWTENLVSSLHQPYILEENCRRDSWGI